MQSQKIHLKGAQKLAIYIISFHQPFLMQCSKMHINTERWKPSFFHSVQKNKERGFITSFSDRTRCFPCANLTLHVQIYVYFSRKISFASLVFIRGQTHCRSFGIKARPQTSRSACAKQAFSHTNTLCGFGGVCVFVCVSLPVCVSFFSVCVCFSV